VGLALPHNASSGWCGFRLPTASSQKAVTAACVEQGLACVPYCLQQPTRGTEAVRGYPQATAVCVRVVQQGGQQQLCVCAGAGMPSFGLMQGAGQAGQL
jgi:hypothetical protein